MTKPLLISSFSSAVKIGSQQVLSAQCLQEPFTSKSTLRLTAKGPWSPDKCSKSCNQSDSWDKYTHTVHTQCTQTLACTHHHLGNLDTLMMDKLLTCLMNVRTGNYWNSEIMRQFSWRAWLQACGSKRSTYSWGWCSSGDVLFFVSNIFPGIMAKKLWSHTLTHMVWGNGCICLKKFKEQEKNPFNS